MRSARSSTPSLQARTGCQWRYLPHDLPPKSAVYYCFALWGNDGTAGTIHDLLRRQVREMRKRREDPTATARPQPRSRRLAVGEVGVGPGEGAKRSGTRISDCMACSARQLTARTQHVRVPA
ncbi:transposase [Streptomyces chartreusis]|uniref:transposase n=1 Tax=Streptomyces chartreusis TaxID=1969 RepID=UPI00362BF0D0